MDRFALFVDAGYLLAACGDLCCGTSRRREVGCRYPALVHRLIGFASEHCGLPVLRLYWYDGARNAAPAGDHWLIAELPNVKLRLGRVVGERQKGVDSLILRDVMTLARERAIVTAYLLGGDEDLREGVAWAQDVGVRVIVLGVPSPTAGRQSAALIREADEHIVLPRGFWEPFFFRQPAGSESWEGQVETAEAVGEGQGGAGPLSPANWGDHRAARPADPAGLEAVGGGGGAGRQPAGGVPGSAATGTAADRRVAQGGAQSQTPGPGQAVAPADPAREAGLQFGRRWLADADAESVAAVRRGLPRLPPDVDAALARYLRRALGPGLRGNEVMPAAREGFRLALAGQAPGGGGWRPGGVGDAPVATG
jgi:hypothetical protein